MAETRTKSFHSPATRHFAAALAGVAMLTTCVVFSTRAADDAQQNEAKGQATTASNEAGKKDKKAPTIDRFPAEIAPLVKKYCVECHGATKPKGDIALHTFKDTAGVLDGRETWEAVLEMLESTAMPPEKSPQPTAAERKLLIAWLEATLYELDCKMKTDPGRVTIRRLNRAEYNNTVRDLLGVDFRPADDFPSDDVGHGFDNIGDVLSLPPLLMEKYIDAAEKIAADAVTTAFTAVIPRDRQSGNSVYVENGARRDRESDFHHVPLRGRIWAEFNPKSPGEFLFRIQAGVDEKTAETAKLEITVDGQTVNAVDVKDHTRFGGRHELRLKLDKGTHRIGASFVEATQKEAAPERDPAATEAKADDKPAEKSEEKKPEEKKPDPKVYVYSVELEGPIDDPVLLAAQKKSRLVLSGTSRRGPSRDGAREILTPLLRRAFRRPVEREEVERFAGLIDLATLQGEQFQRGLEVALTGILVSPHFLFRVERDPSEKSAERPLSDFELASRLSYFLWSTMPDDELFQLAEAGKLHEDEVLSQQVKRMLADPKSGELAENFGSQWLNLRMLEEINPDPQQFAGFTAELKGDMRRETELFFDSIVREDRSILDFLVGNYTFVNERLAKHYGLSGVAGDEFQRVALTDGKRAGVLTQAGILTLTSNPTRTSPVKRGKWIMENILGTPPPEPPANVPELAETQKASPDASLRQQLEIHRKDPNCAVCHRVMDVLGFGLENFDAVGRWREKDGRFAIDASGSLPGGETFKNPSELANILKGKKTEFSRFLTGKMLTYALGRGPIPADRCSVDKIADVLDDHNYRFSVLITEIVKSEPFRKRRSEGEKP